MKTSLSRKQWIMGLIHVVSSIILLVASVASIGYGLSVAELYAAGNAVTFGEMVTGVTAIVIGGCGFYLALAK